MDVRSTLPYLSVAALSAGLAAASCHYYHCRQQQQTGGAHSKIPAEREDGLIAVPQPADSAFQITQDEPISIESMSNEDIFMEQVDRTR